MKTITAKQLTTKAVLFLSLATLFAACSPQKEAIQSPINSGYQDQGIISGEPVKDDNAISKSVVGFVSRKAGLFCTGTIITTNMVLTAAHCAPFIVPGETVVLLGSRLPTSKEDVVVTRPVKAVKVHPAYVPIPEQGIRAQASNAVEAQSSKTQQPQLDINDLAIVQVTTSFPLPYVRAPLLSDIKLLTPKTEAVAMGWGILSVETEQQPNVLYQVAKSLEGAALTKTEIFVPTGPNGEETCSGDSGGPLFAKVGETWFLMGVTSRGDRQCSVGGLYTLVAAHKSFIAESIRDLNSRK